MSASALRRRAARSVHAGHLHLLPPRGGPRPTGRLYDGMVGALARARCSWIVAWSPGVDFVEQIAEVVRLPAGADRGDGSALGDGRGRGRKAPTRRPRTSSALEVESGLSRSEVTRVPVLVSGARMPRQRTLPRSASADRAAQRAGAERGALGYDVERLHPPSRRVLGERAGPSGVSPKRLETPEEADWAPEPRARRACRPTDASVDELSRRRFDAKLVQTPLASWQSQAQCSPSLLAS